MDLAAKIREIEDFPTKGILFRDITTLLQDKAAYRELIDKMAASLEGLKVDKIVGPESRGFIIGAPLAYAIGAGFVPARKPGRLPYETIEYSYELEYGNNILQMHIDAIQPGERVAIVDDLLATGGTSLAVAKLIERLGGEIVAIRFAIELKALGGRETLAGYPVDVVMSM